MSFESQSKASGQTGAPPVIIWWILWFAIVGGLFTIYLVLGQAPSAPVATPPREPRFPIGLVGLGPLVFSAVLRWLILPRLTEPRKALPVFIAGLALAEGCGILGIFLGGEHKNTLVALSFAGLLQFTPFFVGRLYPASTTGLRPS